MYFVLSGIVYMHPRYLPGVFFWRFWFLTFRYLAFILVWYWNTNHFLCFRVFFSFLFFSVLVFFACFGLRIVAALLFCCRGLRFRLLMPCDAQSDDGAFFLPPQYRVVGLMAYNVYLPNVGFGLLSRVSTLNVPG